MDLVDRQLEHEMQFPLSLTPKHDTEHLEGLNTVLTFQGDNGPVDVVLTGRVADPDRFFEALAQTHYAGSLLDCTLSSAKPTVQTTPADFLSFARASSQR